MTDGGINTRSIRKVLPVITQVNNIKQYPSNRTETTGRNGSGRSLQWKIPRPSIEASHESEGRG